MTKPILLLLSLLALSACGGPSTAPSASAEAHALVERGAVLLDVRTPEEFQAGHLLGAINVPVDELADRLLDVGQPDQPVVVYCKSGGRSSRAASTLQAAGFTAVHDLGPMSAW